MRDLLRVIAEPALAERDKKLRAALLEVVGKNKSGAKAVFAMDGSKSQSDICREFGIDKGYLSRLVKTLRGKSLLSEDEDPKIVIAVPPNFFEGGAKQNG